MILKFHPRIRRKAFRIMGAGCAAMGEPDGEFSGPELTSIRSPRVKAARQLGKRALRLRARSFLAEGPQRRGRRTDSSAR